MGSALGLGMRGCGREEFGRGFLMGVVNAASDNEVISVLREV